MPKRRIERVGSRIIDTSVSSTSEDFILHTADDAKTLIRAWGQLSLSPISTSSATSILYGGLLCVDPAGVGVIGASVTQVLDEDVPLQEIGRWYGDTMQNDTNGQIITDKIEFDMKAQRKLKKGDEIVWKHIASTNAAVRARGIIYLWFKE